MCVFLFYLKEKFSKFKDMIKVRRRTLSMEHVCKTPPGWNKETVRGG